MVVAIAFTLACPCLIQAEQIDVLSQFKLHAREKDKCRLTPIDKGYLLEVDEGGQAIMAFQQNTDLPRVGTVIQFTVAIRVESQAAKEITMRYGCRLKEGKNNTINNKFKVTRKSESLTHSVRWTTPKDAMQGNPSFNISFWKPGRYVISSLSYSSYFLDEGETTIAPLEGSISLDDPNIQFRGTRYVRRFPDHIELDRFRSSYYQRDDLAFSPSKARSTSGIMLAFRTTSPTVDLSWGIEPHFTGRKADFAVLLDGRVTTTHSFRLTDVGKSARITIQTGASQDHPVTCEVTYPTFSNPYLVGLRLAPGEKLLPLPASNKKVYVALGDSITHGTGQKGATDKTWAWLFARQANLELFNLAVGGGKVSVPAGQMLADWKHIDLITILIGFNDCMGAGHTVEEYRTSYDALLDAIRKNHSNTSIVCISPTWAPNTKSPKTGLSLSSFRQEVAAIVAARRNGGDENIFLARGEELTSEENNGVHFSTEGAAMFARDLNAELARQGVPK
jgi:lysophospholipase L1-like esterase